MVLGTLLSLTVTLIENVVRVRRMEKVSNAQDQVRNLFLAVDSCRFAVAVGSEV